MHYRLSGKGVSQAIPLVCGMDRRSHPEPLRPSNRTLRGLARCHTSTRTKRTS